MKLNGLTLWKSSPFFLVSRKFIATHGTNPMLTQGPWCLSRKTDIRPTVPVIVDKKHENRAVQDSWHIAKYLDSAYPDTPRLIHTENEGLQFFFYNYCHGQILLPAFKLCVMNIYHLCPTPALKHFFRTNREAWCKMTLEEFAGEESAQIAALKSGLGLIHTTLKSYSYISGDQRKHILVGRPSY